MAEKQVIFMALFKADCYKRFNWWNKGLIPTMESAEAMMSATIRLCTADLVPPIRLAGYAAPYERGKMLRCDWLIFNSNNHHQQLVHFGSCCLTLSCAYRGATCSRGSCTNYIWWYTLNWLHRESNLLQQGLFFHIELVKSKKPLIVVFYMINFITRVLLKVRYI